MKLLCRVFFVCCFSITLIPGRLPAQPGPARSEAAEKALAEIKSTYTKYEYRIPMRDGKRLFTSVYVPKDQSQKYPILMSRTPYSARPYGADQYRDNLGPSSLFGKSGYIFVYQDVRGRWMSEGEYVNMRPHKPTKGPKDIDESTDTYDTIEWLVKHLDNNGKVGMWGISYPGFYTAAGSIDAHPTLKAVSPQAPVTDWFVGDDWHHNGALFLPHMFNFMAGFDHPRPEPTKKFGERFDHGTPDGYDYFLKLGPLSEASSRYFKHEAAFFDEAIKHETYDDFWKARNLRAHLKDVKPEVMTVGGWFDAENLFGALEVFNTIKRDSPKSKNYLVMGPWVHGGWSRGDGAKLGDVHFNAKTSEYYRDNIEFPFFEGRLKDKTSPATQPEAWVFETGANVWRKHDKWPPQNAKPKALYFHAAGKISSELPPDATPENGYDEYVSDPAKPVPFILAITIGMAQEYMTADQRFAARRPDVLVFSTDVLEEDFTIAGPIKADLFVSTTGADSDWIVKLIDVYPSDYPDPNPNPTGVKMGGYQQLVRGDVMRGRFRNSFEKPEAFTPGKPTSVKFAMNDVYHNFRTGHRIMIQVQSSWFPLVNRNPQTFVDIYKAQESDHRKATQRVYRTRELPSHITVLAMP
jgi:putative CocE/NonD family hydrolase